MSKRNLILVIVVIVVVMIGISGFFYFRQINNQTSDNTQGENTNFFADFLPFGNNRNNIDTNTVDTTTVNISDFTPTNQIDESKARLKKVSSFPVAGFGVFMKERFTEIIDPKEGGGSIGASFTEDITETNPPSSEFVVALRYVNKATGNIYQTFADKLDERRFSSTVIPKVYEAYFGNNGESVVLRYLKRDDKTIETFVGKLPKEFLGADGTGTNEITGSFLPENISDISVSPDTSKIFYIFNVGDNAVGVTLALEENSKTQVLNSPFTEWLSLWPQSDTITVTTKPSFNVPGYVYAINPNKKDFKKILGGINGLTTLTSPNGELILYNNSNLSLTIFNTSTKNREILSIKTLPEKCVWGSSSNVLYCAVPKFISRAAYPDAWYQGEVSFSDEIWRIDTKSGNGSLILNPTNIEGGEDIDGIKLSLDENLNYLFFVNKKDSYLWELKLR